MKMKTADIYKDIEYSAENPVINVLFETDFTKEIRIVMQKGTAMKKHKTKFPIVVQLMEGEIDFGVNDEVKNLQKGGLIALDGNIPHDLKAAEDSVIRLTLTKYDETERVRKVIGLDL